MAASARVYRRMRSTSSGSKMSPLAMTGMPTASFTARMQFQSAWPEYIWARVRPWTAMAAAPADSSTCATSTQLQLPMSQPRRILAVTGTGTAAFTASTMRPARSGLRIKAEPSPLFTIFPMGQPMFRSMTCAPVSSRAMAAASAMQAGSLPKICTAEGCSSGKRRSREKVFRSWKHRALEEMSSVQVKAAPSSRQRRRKAASVTPAMGASIRGASSVTLPIRIESLLAWTPRRWDRFPPPARLQRVFAMQKHGKK